MIQASFNSGEWAPQLYSRVDVAKYHSAAALLRNWFVDYRGGASTRSGSEYILQAYKSSAAVRLISFQASFDVGYVLEFGDLYVRFYNNGAPVLETGLSITGATQANPCVLSVANTYAVGDWVQVTQVAGMTQLNGNYYIIAARTAATITLNDLFGDPVDATAFGAYTSGGKTKRVYTLDSPYAAADLALVKPAQNVSTSILCHSDYVPYGLTITTSTNWDLSPIVFGSTISAPNNPSASNSTSLNTGNVSYAYCITAVDKNGQESAASSVATLENLKDLRTTAGTIEITWSAVDGAASYNVYKSDVSYLGPIPDGVAFGFIGNCTAGNFIDSNIAQDYTQSPPVVRNPFANGSSVLSTNVTNRGTYNTTPTLSFTSPSIGVTATGVSVMRARTANVAAGGLGYAIGDTILFVGNVELTVTTILGPGVVSGVSITNKGSVTGSVPTDPVTPVSTDGGGTSATFNFTWELRSITLTDPGNGYTIRPTITFSAGAATATAALGPPSVGNPSVPAFFQQRLVLAATSEATQTLYMSQPGSYYNFNVNQPIQDDSAITASLVSGQLNTIKSMVAITAGLLVLTDTASWLINGGSAGSAVTPAQIVANPQSFNGASDIKPIVCNYDILYVQSKGSIVRDSSYNFYANVFTGADISVMSSHLFYGYTLVDWAWAEEPFKIAWVVRNDGTLLSLTFQKEQEFTGWAHSDTDGSFKSVATVIEDGVAGPLNAVYVVVERTIGGRVVKYIERFADRIYPNGVVDAWCVDAGLQYDSVPATTFSGAQHLAGKTCTGLADGVVIPPFVMPASGTFVLPSASKVTVGLPFIAQLKTMAIDPGNAEGTVQSKVKKINAVTLRVDNALGLKLGSTFSTLVPMKDLVRGNVGSMTNEVVTDLVTGDARTYLDPSYTVPGQYCIQQDLPLPATITGVIPQITVGDTK